MIDLTGVSKVYPVKNGGEVVALDGVNLHVDRGSIHGIGGVWVFRTVCFERVVLSSPGCLWPGRMDDHEEVFEAHA